MRNYRSIGATGASYISGLASGQSQGNSGNTNINLITPQIEIVKFSPSVVNYLYNGDVKGITANSYNILTYGLHFSNNSAGTWENPFSTALKSYSGSMYNLSSFNLSDATYNIKIGSGNSATNVWDYRLENEIAIAGTIAGRAINWIDPIKRIRVSWRFPNLTTDSYTVSEIALSRQGANSAILFMMYRQTVPSFVLAPNEYVDINFIFQTYFKQ